MRNYTKHFLLMMTVVLAMSSISAFAALDRKTVILNPNVGYQPRDIIITQETNGTGRVNGWSIFDANLFTLIQTVTSNDLNGTPTSLSDLGFTFSNTHNYPIDYSLFQFDYGGGNNACTNGTLQDCVNSSLSYSPTGWTNFRLLTLAPLSIITTSLPNARVSEPYSQTLQAAGGTVPFFWSIIAGNLPAGFSINSSIGEILGVPTTVETTNFTVQVADVDNQKTTKDLSITVHGNTPVGSNVSVGPLSGITLTFSGVTQEGQTIIASSSSGPTPPSGFKLGNPPTYYSISTTAQSTPPVQVCISYNPAQFKNTKNLKLFHFENGAWINATTLLDTVNHIICGNVSSFSELALVENITIDHLIDEVNGFNLKPDIQQGLLDKLNAAKPAIDRHQNKTAANILRAFVNFINAQRGKGLTVQQADLLSSDAKALSDFLSPSLLSTIFKWIFFGWLDKFVNAVLGSKL